MQRRRHVASRHQQRAAALAGALQQRCVLQCPTIICCTSLAQLASERHGATV